MTHGQITDIYLLALAVRHHAKLATFDRRLAAAAIHGGRTALELVPLP
jgi:predicted nucleic acid-binding protein